MRRLRAIWIRIWGTFGNKRESMELDEELESHLQMHIEDNVRSGMSEPEARRQALIRLGGLEQTKESYRERQRLPGLETLWQDVRFGLRMLLKSRGFTVVAVLTLGLGIGANTALFSVLNAVLLDPLPYPHAEELITVHAAKQNFNEGFHLLSEFSRLAARQQDADRARCLARHGIHSDWNRCFGRGARRTRLF